MMPTSLLPALVTTVIVLIAASVIAALALYWTTDLRAKQIVRRVWLAIVILTVLGLAIFWIGTAMIGTSTVDRSMQQQQQDDLHKRLGKGGH